MSNGWMKGAIFFIIIVIVLYVGYVVYYNYYLKNKPKTAGAAGNVETSEPKKRAKKETAAAGKNPFSRKK